jgi:beta-fructofuranosidase
VLRLPDHWVWDFWHCHDGERHHLFYLKAPRALGDPELRHWNVAIGHSVSNDLVAWDERPDALCPGPAGSWDDFTTWTGSVVGGPGDWSMLYTGTSHGEEGLVQRIGLARSADLDSWQKYPGNPVLETDPRWYELLDQSVWHDEAWRDPWVMPDPEGGGYLMFLTARAATGPPEQRGVIARAVSHDLAAWEVLPPLEGPRFTGQMEIPQVVEIGGRWYLVYSGHTEGHEGGGSFVLAADDVLGPYEVQEGARPLAEAPWYGARIIATGGPRVIAWKGRDARGEFAGIVGDPRPIRSSPDGALEVVASTP